MKYKKISAFISSNYESLKDERNIVINSLLDAGMIPICMEYFTAASSKNFDDIKIRIDQSDLFIMILGSEYGSTDENGISWTEREYEYACDQNKITYVILSKKFSEMAQAASNGAKLTDARQKQLNFAKRIKFPQKEEDGRPLDRIMRQILSSNDFSECIGWQRNDGGADKSAEKSNLFVLKEILGQWFHVHLKEVNNDYIRLGTVDIKQKENDCNIVYKLEAEASNYDVLRYDPETDTFDLNDLSITRWNGDYHFKDANTLIGIYVTRRETNGKYDDWAVEEGIYKGIHELKIVKKNNAPASGEGKYRFEGTFQDVYPSPKKGQLYMFRTEKERNGFLKKYFDDVLRRKCRADLS